MRNQKVGRANEEMGNEGEETHQTSRPWSSLSLPIPRDED